MWQFIYFVGHHYPNNWSQTLLTSIQNVVATLTWPPSTLSTFMFLSSKILILRIQIFFLGISCKAKVMDMSYPVDAITAITLAGEGKWLSDTLDVLLGKRNVYPGIVFGRVVFWLISHTLDILVCFIIFWCVFIYYIAY